MIRCRWRSDKPLTNELFAEGNLSPFPNVLPISVIDGPRWDMKIIKQIHSLFELKHRDAGEGGLA